MSRNWLIHRGGREMISLQVLVLTYLICLVIIAVLWLTDKSERDYWKRENLRFRYRKTHPYGGYLVSWVIAGRVLTAPTSGTFSYDAAIRMSLIGNRRGRTSWIEPISWLTKEGKMVFDVMGQWNSYIRNIPS